MMEPRWFEVEGIDKNKLDGKRKERASSLPGLSELVLSNIRYFSILGNNFTVTEFTSHVY